MIAQHALLAGAAYRLQGCHYDFAPLSTLEASPVDSHAAPSQQNPKKPTLQPAAQRIAAIPVSVKNYSGFQVFRHGKVTAVAALAYSQLQLTFALVTAQSIPLLTFIKPNGSTHV